VESHDVVSGATYYHEILDVSYFSTRHGKTDARMQWHQEALKTLENPELVFLDPDNGLKADAETGLNNAVKYVFSSECRDYYLSGKDVVYYCSKGRRTPEQWERAKHLMNAYVPGVKLLALTFHKETQRTYIFVIHPERFEKYEKLVSEFMESGWGRVFSVEAI